MTRAVTSQGAVTGDLIQQGADCDAFNALPTLLTGSADAINPHVSGNYIIKTAGVNAMTLAAPTVGLDDNLSIQIWSDTTNAHTLTATTLLANGTALKTTATFAAFRGAGIGLRAYNGVWQTVSNTAVTLT
jgi:hypothetical protein